MVLLSVTGVEAATGCCLAHKVLILLRGGNFDANSPAEARHALHELFTHISWVTRLRFVVRL
jgi:hypothetical protein